MRIAEVTIEKFRSIKCASFRMNNITAVVGENNAGKTAVLRALNAVLNYSYEEQSFINKTHQYAPRNNTYIAITFEDIPSKQIYSDKIIDGKITLKFSYSYSDNRKKYTVIHGRESIIADDEFLKELSKDILYVYIPAGRTNKDVGWNEDSIFRELISNFVARHTETRDTLSSYVRRATNKIHDSVFTKLEKEINALYMQNKEMNFKIGFPESLDYTVLLRNTEIALKGDGSNFLLEEWGSGTKSMAIIAMHRANALIKGENIVLGIEEPEINLHPQAQKRFILSLKNAMQKTETQVIFTTHSTVLVDELEHDDILLVRRTHDNSRGFHSDISQLRKDFWKRCNVEEFKHYQYFHYKNSAFFFSKFVVIGESKNDCQVFEKLVSPEIGSKIADVSFLDAGGVESLKYPYFLLKELHIPFVIIVDRDFFFPYSNNELDNSRNSVSGLPSYGCNLKNNEIIDDLFKSVSEKTTIEESHKKGYRAFFEAIKSYSILSMNYCLEMDLTCSIKAREEYYQILNIMPDKQSQRYLLVDNKKTIKDIGKITRVIDRIPRNSLPESYKKIRAQIVKEINKNV